MAVPLPWSVKVTPPGSEPQYVRLGVGKASARVYTTDFSYEYVKINAEYRS